MISDYISYLSNYGLIPSWSSWAWTNTDVRTKPRRNNIGTQPWNTVISVRNE